MAGSNFQTVRLTAGRHESPEHGACVMELASMLGEEEFTDHPRSVCPVIGAFLRLYNDRVDATRRQDLYPYAAAVVGTGGDRKLSRRRAQACRRWSRELRREYDLARPVAVWPLMRSEVSGAAAARLALECSDPGIHARTLEFVDSLIAMGREEVSAEPLPLAADRLDSPADIIRQQTRH